MKHGHLTFFLFLLLIISSCKNEQKGDSNLPTATTDEALFALMKDSMAAIDAMTENPTCTDYSLDFSKENNERYFAQLFCDSTGKVLQMTENKMDANGYSEINKLYYNQKQLFATYSGFQTNTNNQLAFIEELTFFKNGKITSSYRRTAKNGDQYLNEYEPSKNNRIVNDQQILKAMENKGEFVLTFQGVIRTDEFNYIIVGEPKKNGFTSTLQITAHTPFIDDLFEHEREYVNRKIKVNFQRITDGNFSYQLFISGNWVK